MTSLTLERTAIATTVERAAAGDEAAFARIVAAYHLDLVRALVTWEGDFLASPEFDEVLKAEPRWFDLITPWAHLADKPALPVSMLLSEEPGENVQAPFSKADLPAFLALRDKDGTLARLMKQTGAIDDGIFSVADEQRVLYEALLEQGNPVSLDIMPGSTHMYLSEEGWEVFLAAFEKAKAGA